MTAAAVRPPRAAEAPALAAALAAGSGFHAAGLPLAFVIGPLLACAAFAVAGRPVYAPVAGRKAGQLVIGTTIGLKVTPGTVVMAATWVPLMVAAGLGAVMLAAAMSAPMAQAARIDRKTAFFAMLPGGLSEMANVGARVGAAAEPIALTQAMRVALVVLLLPPAVILLGEDAGIAAGPSAVPLPLGRAALLLAAAPLGVALLRLLRLNNPWILGAILTAALLSASGVLEGAMPLPLFYAGQFLLGIAIGARFRRESLRRLPRVAAAGAACLIGFAAAMMLVAAGLAVLTPFDFATLALGTSPGGMAEMAVTAQTLHLEVAMVTAFHLVRTVLMNGFAQHYWHLFERVLGR